MLHAIITPKGEEATAMRRVTDEGRGRVEHRPHSVEKGRSWPWPFGRAGRVLEQRRGGGEASQPNAGRPVSLRRISFLDTPSGWTSSRSSGWALSPHFASTENTTPAS